MTKPSFVAALAMFIAFNASAATLTLGVIERADDERLALARVELAYPGQPGGPIHRRAAAPACPTASIRGRANACARTRSRRRCLRGAGAACLFCTARAPTMRSASQLRKPR